MAAGTATFTTIGHSNRGLEEFTQMLLAARVGLVVDVRRFPRSRRNPVFNIDTLPENLAAEGIAYRHIEALAGRRKKQRAIDANLNGMWRVEGFHNYADYALGDEFAEGLAEVIDLGDTQRLALMCSEAVWWRCHRRIITDYLLLRGHPVDHLMAPGQTQHATPTPGATKTAEGRVVYPAPPGET